MCISSVNILCCLLLFGMIKCSSGDGKIKKSSDKSGHNFKMSCNDGDEKFHDKSKIPIGGVVFDLVEDVRQNQRWTETSIMELSKTILSLQRTVSDEREKRQALAVKVDELQQYLVSKASLVDQTPSRSDSVKHR